MNDINNSKGDDCMLFKKMLDKGFKRTTYEDQEDLVFYSLTVTDTELLDSISKHLGEDIMFFDGHHENLYCTIEITEDITQAQYIFTEINFDTGVAAYDPLTLEEFENLLDILPDSEIKVNKEYIKEPSQ